MYACSGVVRACTCALLFFGMTALEIRLCPCSSHRLFLPCTISIICRNEYTHTLNCRSDVSEVCVCARARARCSRLNRRRREEQRFIKSTLSLQSVPFIGCEDSSSLRCGRWSGMTCLWAMFSFSRNDCHTTQSSEQK